MGSGASMASPQTGAPGNKAPENSKATVQTDGTNDFRSTAYATVLRILSGQQSSAENADGENVNADPDSPAKSTQMRASVLLLTKLIADMVPCFKSYTIEDPNKDELEKAAKNRQLLSNPESYLEFYTTVYKHLYDSGGGSLAFMSKPITFKNSFLNELMRILVFEGSHKASFSERVRYFGNKHKANGILLPDYGLIGEAILRGMRHVQRVPIEAVWPKMFSRFLRSLVPSMIIAESGTVSPANELLPVGNSGDSAERSMTDSGMVPNHETSLSLQEPE